jgi:hypothetical protein
VYNVTVARQTVRVVATSTRVPLIPRCPRLVPRGVDDGMQLPALYKRRGATVEPGIGNLKKIIDRFSRRGRDAATSELHLAATAFNLMKIHRAAAPA